MYRNIAKKYLLLAYQTKIALYEEEGKNTQHLLHLMDNRYLGVCIGYSHDGILPVFPSGVDKLSPPPPSLPNTKVRFSGLLPMKKKLHFAFSFSRTTAALLSVEDFVRKLEYSDCCFFTSE